MNFSLEYIAQEIKKNYKSKRWWRNRVIIPYVFGSMTRIHPNYPGYENAVHVMEEDWDNMIVLDACRADFFEKVVDVSRFDEYRTAVSLGSHSSEWTRRNFQNDKFGDTVYVSANPHTTLEAENSFHKIIELWDSNFDHDAGTVTPDVVRDRAIDCYEEYPNKKFIIHFMQPHGPFIGSDLGNELDSDKEYWQAYEQNLRYVFQYAEDIIDVIPGKTVITADHGLAHSSGIKNWLGLTGHKSRLRLPSMVEVPWAVTDDQRRDILEGEVSKAGGDNIQERLKDLGYL